MAREIPSTRHAVGNETTRGGFCLLVFFFCFFLFSLYCPDSGIWLLKNPRSREIDAFAIARTIAREDLPTPDRMENEKKKTREKKKPQRRRASLRRALEASADRFWDRHVTWSYLGDDGGWSEASDIAMGWQLLARDELEGPLRGTLLEKAHEFKRTRPVTREAFAKCAQLRRAEHPVSRESSSVHRPPKLLGIESLWCCPLMAECAGVKE